MYELFFQSFNQKVSLTSSEEEKIKHYLTPKKLRKKQYLLQEGDPCKFVAFVEKGALRSYSIDEKGSERIVQFALENWLISDLYSFLTGEPATYISSPVFMQFIEARALELGHSIGVTYGEGFTKERHLGVRNLFDLL